VKALGEEEEGILRADINLEDCTGPAGMVDIIGHSARPDLLSLLVGEPPGIAMKKYDSKSGERQDIKQASR